MRGRVSRPDATRRALRRWRSACPFRSWSRRSRPADFIALVTAWMSDRLAPSTELHGVMVDVLGIGVLMVGKSGIGKSETALDLVVRGHRLVADDVVLLRRHGHQLAGRGAGILGHHMEIRGLGIINVKDLFGISAVREAKVVDLIARAPRVGRQRRVRPARLRRSIRARARDRRAEDPPAGAARAQPRDADRSCGAQPAPQGARHSLGARAFRDHLDLQLKANRHDRDAVE